MARPPKPITFLERSPYRQRRLRDVAWVLPVIGAVLVMVPLLWPRGVGDDLHRTSTALTFLFLVWIGLIGVAFVLARSLRNDAAPKLPDAAQPRHHPLAQPLSQDEEG